MRLAQRLHEWREIAETEPVEESHAVRGGRRGEERLRDLIASSYRFHDAVVLSGRRIPTKEGRRREIDLIVCTPQMLHLIEVKNWSGQLTAEDGRWLQTRRGGSVVEHRSPVETSHVKRDVVIDYLRECGVDLDRRFAEEHIHSKVIFMNRRLEMAPGVEEMPEVISRQKLDEYLGHRREERFFERLFAALIDCCLDSETRLGRRLSRRIGRIPSRQFEQIVSCLSKVRTWDQLHLYGTRIIAGDLLRLRIGPRAFEREDLERMTGGGARVDLHWTRSSVWGPLKAITGLGSLGTITLGRQELEVSPADAVQFHEVGEEEPAFWPLVEIEAIDLG